MTPFTISICDIDDVVRREAAEAQEKIRDAWYWGLVGTQQAHAVQCAIAIIKQHLDESGAITLEPCLEALRTQRQSFMDGSYDTDGYAAATLWAIPQPFENYANGNGGSDTSRLGTFLQRRRARRVLSSAIWTG